MHTTQRFGIRQLWYCAPALVLTLVLGACKSSASVPDPEGTYSLIAVGGKSVPCPVQHEGSPLVKSGSFTFGADHTCVSTVTFAIPQRTEDVVRTVKATYTRKGDELTFRWEGAGMTKGQLQGNRFSMNNEGIVFEYQR
jgi:hypothetical protein